jgi:hypothetical protein
VLSTTLASSQIATRAPRRLRPCRITGRGHLLPGTIKQAADIGADPNTHAAGHRGYLSELLPGASEDVRVVFNRLGDL